jgi:hypothetical protein
MFRTLIALPYELARMPLVIIDKNLSDRRPESSAPRVGLDRAIGTADKLAGALLGNRDIAQRGARRLDLSDKLAAAARLEREAETRREQARQTVATGQRKAAAKRSAAQRRAVTGLDEAAAAETRGKQEARTKAVKTAAAKKRAADQRAADRVASVEQRKKRAVAVAETKKRTTQRKAKVELADARATKRSAAATRADAERLSDLEQAKKQSRKQS